MENKQLKTPVIDMLKDFENRTEGYFCIPSHHRGTGADEKFKEIIGDTLRYDLTETPLTDDLHEPEGAILEAQELAAELFGAKKTFFLVNGTTCANEAMIISSVYKNEKILVARNCHKSVLMGLIISGAEPIYIEPQKSSLFNTFGSVSPESVEEAFKKNSGIKACILTSPTYYGITSDLKSIAEICHKNNALLLVDEAHGSHLAFSDKLPPSAIQSGADMAAQSIHKTLGSMTQTSMLHVNNGDFARVDAALKIVQSTSPSYILMASLDGARHNMAVNGKELIENMVKTADYLREKLSGIDGVFCPCEADGKEVFDFDRTRLVFSVKGLTGFEVSDRLVEKHGIVTELADNYSVVAIIGHADTKEDADKLINAVAEIAEYGRNREHTVSRFEYPEIPPMAMLPRTIFFSPSKRIDFKDCVGTISAEMIAPYPPGIPVIYPGEIITPDVHEFLSKAIEEGRHIHGFSDKTMKTIQIIRYDKNIEK